MQCVLRLKFSLGNLGGAPYSVVVLSADVRTVRNVGPLSFLVILSVRHPLHLNNIEINLGSEVGRMRTKFGMTVIPFPLFKYYISTEP